MVFHDGTTFPGVVIACTPVGAVKLTEKEDGRREKNDRVIPVPQNDDRCRDARDLTSRVKRARSLLPVGNDLPQPIDESGRDLGAWSATRPP